MPQKQRIIVFDGLKVTYVDGADNNYVNTIIYIHFAADDYLASQISLPNGDAENLFETIAAGAGKIHGAKVELRGYDDDDEAGSDEA